MASSWTYVVISEQAIPEITLHTSRHALLMADDVWPCYRQVFGGFDDLNAFRAELFDRHARREGFCLVTASDAGTVVGFSWGYIGQRGQFWSDLVGEALPDDIVNQWIGGHFEFVELAVSASFRGRGLGVVLHDRLLADVERRCLLSTVDDPADPAVRLYLRAGWHRLGTLRPGVQVMGRYAAMATSPPGSTESS